MNPALLEKIRSIERRHVGADAPRSPSGSFLSTGWADVDAALHGGLSCGGVHEWFGVVAESAGASTNRSLWRPPVCVLIHFVWRVLDAGACRNWTVWIGRKCFPYPATLLRQQGADRALLQRSLFLAPRTPADRLWAMDLVTRSPAVGAVVADGSTLDMAATRRIQLVAKNHGKHVFLARPPWEQSELSAAQTRWLVRSAKAGEDRRMNLNPAWTIELMRCKGVHWTAADTIWRLEWNRAQCTLHLSTPLADSAGEAQTVEDRRPRRRFA